MCHFLHNLPRFQPLCVTYTANDEKSPEKNRNEIHHSLCMPHGSTKSWQIMKKMKHKNLNIVRKTSSFVGYLNYRRSNNQDLLQTQSYCL